MVCVRYWVVAIGDYLDRELQLFFSSLFAVWICVSQRACGASAQPLTVAKPVGCAWGKRSRIMMWMSIMSSGSRLKFRSWFKRGAFAYDIRGKFLCAARKESTLWCSLNPLFRSKSRQSANSLHLTTKVL